jgi:hypothetical protein
MVMTTASDVQQLSFGEILAICSSFDFNDKATVDHVSSVVGRSSVELEAGIKLEMGMPAETRPQVDVDQYIGLFDMGIVKMQGKASPLGAVAQPEADRPQSGVASPITGDRPQTATKQPRSKVKKKPGRQGERVKKAFAAIPFEKTPLEDFAKKHNVSEHCLRQHTRFDEKSGTAHLGKVRTQKDKTDGRSYIWRERPEEDAEAAPQAEGNTDTASKPEVSAPEA